MGTLPELSGLDLHLVKAKKIKSRLSAEPIRGSTCFSSARLSVVVVQSSARLGVVVGVVQFVFSEDAMKLRDMFELSFHGLLRRCMESREPSVRVHGRKSGPIEPGAAV